MLGEKPTRAKNSCGHFSTWEPGSNCVATKQPGVQTGNSTVPLSTCLCCNCLTQPQRPPKVGRRRTNLTYGRAESVPPVCPVGPVCLVCLVCLVCPVCPVYLVFLVCLVCLACLLSLVFSESSVSSVPACVGTLTHFCPSTLTGTGTHFWTGTWEHKRHVNECNIWHKAMDTYL